MRRFVAILGVLLCVATVLADTRWYVVELQGQPAGWMTIERREAGETVTTITAMRVAVGRQGSVVVTAFTSEVVERRGGNVLSMRRSIEGVEDDEAAWRFDGKDVTLERDGQNQTLPSPQGVYVGPDAERAYLARHIAEGDKSISTRVLDPLSGLDPVPTLRKRIGEEAVDGLETVRFETRRGDEQRVVDEWIDAHGDLVRARTSIGAVVQEIRLSDEAAARRALAKPPDLIDATRVSASRAIRGYQRLRSAAFVLRGNADTPSLTTGPQTAERIDDDAVRVTVELGETGHTVELTDEEHEALLAATDLLEVGDELVIQLAERATRSLPPAATPGAKAETLRAFVHRYINRKNLDIALASAATVARDREGDCTEHATLLAALLRVERIPSKLVAGLSYEAGSRNAPPAFVYHVWTQALIEGEEGSHWVDLDATHRLRPRHVTQIALSISDGSNANDLWQGLAPTLGTISIEVEATR
ncbi:MAG: transglutaminase family protein [Phycisphaera sp.]|nr:MAG: transglutaminase family protein [Phycisphaera sp.]